MREQDLPIPLDVRLMSLTASVLYAIVAALLVVGGVMWGLQHPWFSFTGVQLQGELAHVSDLSVRQYAVPRLKGNFFTMDLEEARRGMESVPWVRRAVVQREFPNRLLVQVQEHEAVAAWGGEGDSRMVNTFGEVFDTQGIDVVTDDLPRLSGPQEQASHILEMYRALFPLLRELGSPPAVLELTERGSWRVQLVSDTVLELGRGTQADVLARTRRFVQSMPEITARYGRNPTAIEAADLRYSQGYALRLRGVTTTAAQVVAPKEEPARVAARPPVKPPATRPAAAGARR